MQDGKNHINPPNFFIVPTHMRNKKEKNNKKIKEDFIFLNIKKKNEEECKFIVMQSCIILKALP
jgi:hypothetical protein